MAKAPILNGSDGEGRKLRVRIGLDTRVFLAVNAANYVVHVLREHAVPERKR